jgi:hypothetical protein
LPFGKRSKCGAYHLRAARRIAVAATTLRFRRFRARWGRPAGAASVVDDDSPQPGVERAVSAEGRSLEYRCHERVLDDVTRVLTVACDRGGDPAQLT